MVKIVVGSGFWKENEKDKEFESVAEAKAFLQHLGMSPAKVESTVLTEYPDRAMS